jgi:rare lipoprotein A
MQRIWLTVPVWLLFATGGLAVGAPLADSHTADSHTVDSHDAKQEAQHLDALPPVKPGSSHQIDQSGRKQEGQASYYGPGFVDKKMADGRRLNPNANTAASKTLPLGSVAEVTNLDNGKSTTVKVEDRGPYARNRIIDVTPKVAHQLDLQHTGIAPVVVKPITVPTSDGTVKLGAGAAHADPKSVAAAVATTERLTAPVEASR